MDSLQEKIMPHIKLKCDKCGDTLNHHFEKCDNQELDEVCEGIFKPVLDDDTRGKIEAIYRFAVKNETGDRLKFFTELYKMFDGVLK